MKVEFKNVEKKFGNAIAVNNLNLKIEKGEFIVLLGPSGSGKSTSLRLLAGLETPTSGEIFIGNTLMNDVLPKDRDIAMVFQNYALYPHMDVYDNIAFPLEVRKESIIDAKKVIEAIEESGVKEEMLILEIVHPFEAKEDNVIEDLKESCRYWKEYL